MSVRDALNMCEPREGQEVREGVHADILIEDHIQFELGYLRLRRGDPEAAVDIDGSVRGGANEGGGAIIGARHHADCMDLEPGPVHMFDEPASGLADRMGIEKSGYEPDPRLGAPPGCRHAMRGRISKGRQRFGVKSCGLGLQISIVLAVIGEKKDMIPRTAIGSAMDTSDW